MKSITEEQRQALIEDCRWTIEGLEISIKNGGRDTPHHLVSELLRQEIALASLTAEPTHYVFNHPNGKLFNALVDESCKGHNDVRPGYTAPPASPTEPVIKLPDIKVMQCPSFSDNNYASGYLDGVNACIIETKRLNGLG